MDKEAEIKKYMSKLGLSYKEAQELWEDDHNDELKPEQAELEKKAKEAGRMYVATEKNKGKKKRPKVIDSEKAELLTLCKKALGVTPTSEKEGAEFSFQYNGNDYTMKLIKHRK